MTRFDLDGIDAANPLGFLAAIGTLAAATRIWPTGAVRLGWETRLGGWRPVLAVASDVDRSELVEALDRSLRAMSDHPAFSAPDNLSVPVETFSEWAKAAQGTARPSDRLYADLVAAFGSEAVQSTNSGKPNGNNADTAFRHIGAGQQRFFACVRSLVQDTRDIHLAKTLFEPWRYDDPLEKHSLRWDPNDDVRRALRWNDPSGDPERRRSGAMWGANRLAIEALPLFPTAPGGRGLETTGFLKDAGRPIRWTWPVWNGLLSIDAVRSVLALRELQVTVPNRVVLARLGIVEVFRVYRVMQDKYRNFSAAVPA